MKRSLLLLASLVAGIGLTYAVSTYADFEPTGGVTYRLQSSVGLADTTIRISSFKNRSLVPLTLSSMSTDVIYGTIEPQSTNSEFVSCTGVTQNSDGTATLSGCSRGLSDLYPFAASTTLQRAHAGQSVFILSDSPAFFNEYAIKRNAETISGDWDFTGQTTFSNFPITPSNSTSSETVAGIVQLATGAQLAAGTSLGSTGARLVPPNDLATSTYSTSTAAFRIPVTNSSGLLDNRFLGTTSVQFYSSNVIVNGISVSSTTISTYTGTTSTHTWVKPTSGTMAFIEAWGAGGGAGADNSGSGGAACGGGGGGYISLTLPMSMLGATETVTVGTGGNGAASTGNAGTAGTQSSFGTWVVAGGGGGGGFDSSNGTCYGGGGGYRTSASGGTSGKPFGVAGLGTNTASSTGYLGGGGAGNPATGGADGASAGANSDYGGGGGVSCASGGTADTCDDGGVVGGTSILGGAGGAGGVGANARGGAGTVPGGGGGGAMGGTTSIGGVGAAGMVRVTVF